MAKYLSDKLKLRIERKKQELDGFRPLPKTALNRLKREFELEWTYNSNAIEGNSLTLNETRLVLEEGITIGNKSLRDHFEAINHKEAIKFVEDLSTERKRIQERDLLQLHNLIMKNLDIREKGQYRTGNVYIAGANFVPCDAIEIPARMIDFFEYINKNPEKLDPIELAAKAHFNLVHIHPFADGNGRMARLLMNLMLIRSGFPIMIVLNTDRKMYYRRLRLADRGNYIPFIEFIARGVERSLNLYINALRKGGIKYISLLDATKYCDYSQEYLSLLARKGKLESMKLGRNWVTTKEAIKEYKASVGKK